MSCSITPFLNCVVYEIMWKNTGEPDGPQMTFLLSYLGVVYLLYMLHFKLSYVYCCLVVLCVLL